jgi:TRAP-type C4-dicarboxylate transport system permease small subunit
MKMIFERLPRWMIGLLMFLAVAINVANVIARYLFHAPLIWAEEILTFILIWTVFMGVILVSGDQAHLKMDLVATAFPKEFTRRISMIIEFVTVIVSMAMVVASTKVLHALGGYDQRSIVAEIPMVIPHFAVLLGFCAIGILNTVNLVNKFRDRAKAAQK